jgi:hypothetical protein
VNGFSGQQINIKFCVTLGKNANICAMLSEAYGGEAMKKSGQLSLLCRNFEVVMLSCA